MTIKKSNDSLHLATLCVSTILCGGLATPALGQNVSTPPERLVVDENGVDLFQRNLFLRIPQLPIGNAESGLNYTRFWVGDGWRNNFTLIVRAISTDTFVTVGDRTFKFKLISGAYVPDTATGETLTATSTTFTFTDRDGMIAVFDRSYANRWYLTNVDALGTSMTFPSGEVITLTYKNFTGPVYTESTRLQSANSTSGYQIKFGYASSNSDVMTVATAINNAVDYCNPSADSCAGLTQAWPTVTYTTSDSPDGLTTTETATDNLGRVTKYTSKLFGINADLRLTGIKRPSSPTDTTLITYSNKGKLATVSNGVSTWLYGGGPTLNNTASTITDPLGHVRNATFDTTTANLLTYSDELGRVTSYSYDALKRLEQITQPEGNYVAFIRDGRGNINQTTQVSKTPGTPADIVTSAVFPASCSNVRTCNKPISTTDARGNATEYTYDPLSGLVISVKSPAPTAGGVRPEARYTYTPLYTYYKNSSGLIVRASTSIKKLTDSSVCTTTAACIGTADEVKSTYNYGPQISGVANNLLPLSATKSSGNNLLTATVATVYDVFGNIYSVDGPLAGSADTSRFRYDAGRQLVGFISADPDGAGIRKNRAQRTAYDADGHVSNVEIGNVNSQSDADWASMTVSQNAATTYDSTGRPVKVEQKSGTTTYAVTQTSYDALGRIDCTAERMNPAAFGSLPASACTLGTQGNDGPDRISKTTYDTAGQVIKVQSAVGTGAQADEVSRSYNLNGTLATLTDAEGNLTTYEYDGFDRLFKIRYPVPTAGLGTSSTTDYEQLVYDANGNVTSRRLRGYSADSTNHIDYSYDALNRLTYKNLPGTEADVAYAYDNIGRVNSETDTAGNYVALGFDALGRTVSQATPLGTFQMAYDPAGRRTMMTWPDGFYVTYDHLVTGEVTAIRENGAASGIGVLATYAYDDLGRGTNLTRGNGTSTTYTVDPVSRLTSLTLDLAGTTNDLTLGFSYNPAGQIASTTRSNDLYAYTASANMDKATGVNGLNQAVSSGTATITYDARGNLISAGTDSFTYSAENHLLTGSVTTFTYDPLGRMYQFHASTGDVNFLYDGDHMVGESLNGSLALRTVFGPGADEPLVRYGISGGTTTRAWLHADERGSIVAMTDDAGSVLNMSRYDEYGVPAANYISRFQYTGQAWIREVGLYYYKSRFYSTRLGRFMQTDPIGYGGGMNFYNYVGSDPVNKTDPSGLCTGSRIEANCPGGISPGSSGHAYGDLSGLNGEQSSSKYSGGLVLRIRTFPSDCLTCDPISTEYISLGDQSRIFNLGGLDALEATDIVVTAQKTNSSITTLRTQGVAPWDPKGQGGYYVMAQAEEAAIMQTHSAMVEQLARHPGSNAKIGMKPYNNTSLPRLPNALGQWYEARVVWIGLNFTGEARLLINTADLNVFFYSPVHYRWFIPGLVDKQ